jgi:hypothetical protein
MTISANTEPRGDTPSNLAIALINRSIDRRWLLEMSNTATHASERTAAANRIYELDKRRGKP